MGRSLLGAIVLATIRNGGGTLIQRPGTVVADNGTTCNVQVDTDGHDDFPGGQRGVDGRLRMTSAMLVPRDHALTENTFCLRGDEAAAEVAELRQVVSQQADQLAEQAHTVSVLTDKLAELSAKPAQAPALSQADIEAMVDARVAKFMAGSQTAPATTPSGS